MSRAASADLIRAELDGGRWISIATHRVRVVDDGSGSEVIAEVAHPKGCRRSACELLGSMEKHSMFHGPEPIAAVISERMPSRIPKVLYALGSLVGVVYNSAKWDGKKKDYYHEFENERPLLCGDRANRLWIVGGSYSVTADGIEG